MIKITFPDGSAREYSEGTTSLEIAENISPRLAKEVYSVTVNGNWRMTFSFEDEDAVLTDYLDYH